VRFLAKAEDLGDALYPGLKRRGNSFLAEAEDLGMNKKKIWA